LLLSGYWSHLGSTVVPVSESHLGSTTAVTLVGSYTPAEPEEVQFLSHGVTCSTTPDTKAVAAVACMCSTGNTLYCYRSIVYCHECWFSWLCCIGPARPDAKRERSED
jgi:hypothetical protein